MRPQYITFLILFVFYLLLHSNPLSAQQSTPIAQWWLLTSHSNKPHPSLDRISNHGKYQITPHQYIVFLSADEIGLFQEHFHLEKVPTDLKISINLSKELEENILSSSAVLIKTFPMSTQELELFANSFKIKNIQPAWLEQGVIRGVIQHSDLPTLLDHPQLLWIEKAYEDQALDEQVLGITNTSVLMPRLNQTGLTGNNILVGIGDNSDLSHIDFHQRVISYHPGIIHNHGEHISGSIAGKGIKDWYGRGFAPNAKIISDYFSQIIVKSAHYTEQLGMSVTNNSYGQFLGDCDFMGTYNALSQTIDQIFINTPNVLHVFAAANDGQSNCFPYHNGYRTVNGGFASAKNNIVVANKGKATIQVNPTSSKGPTRDGRIKPEITAIGTDVYAPIADQNYVESSGTSMAGPNVAGAAILLQEYFKTIYGTLPNSHLLKNVLINAADHLNTEGPNFQYGYGLLNSFKSQYIIEHDQFFEGLIESQQIITHQIIVPPNTKEIKILLNWMDPPGHPAAEKALVHDLNLKVITPNHTYLPWILNPLADQVTAPPIRGIDTLNNVEQISIRDPEPGLYEIQISAEDLLYLQQSYALSYYMEDAFVSLNYPVDGLSLSQDKPIYIYWDHHQNSTATSNLYYKIGTQTQWLPIEQNIAPNIKHHIWQPPAATNNEVIQFKIVHGSLSDSTQNEGVLFTARPEISPLIASQQCWGHIRFQWSPIQGIDTYVIYQLINDDLAIMDTVQGNYFYQLSSLDPDQTYWYAVAGYKNNRIGIRSIAHSAQPNGLYCEHYGINGDLALIKDQHLPFGRKNTSYSLSHQELIPFIVKNASPNPITDYKIKFKINQQPWQEQIFNTPLAIDETLTLELQNIDLSAVGLYDFILVIENMDELDENSTNDTLYLNIIHADNPPIDLEEDWVENFESWDFIDVRAPLKGIGLNHQWDFIPHDTFGRSYLDPLSLWSIEGNNSLSIDNYKNISVDAATSSKNLITATLNLSNYNVHTDEIRLFFDYILHGNGAMDNQVKIRGSDLDPWIHVLEFPTQEEYLNTPKRSPFIDISDLLKTQDQNLSSSFQISFVQQDSTKIGAVNFGTGLTLDNISIAKIFRDLEMTELLTHQNIFCGHHEVSLSTTIKNNVNSTLYNVPISLYDQGEILTTQWIDSISANASRSIDLDYTLEGNIGEKFELYAVVHHSEDDYASNDTSEIIEIIFLSEINEFPYFNNFDEDNGGWMTTGAKNVWDHGAISSNYIINPYTENKSWYSNFSNNSLSIKSYLYSPCFDISTLNNPHLSFMISYYFLMSPDHNLYDNAKIQYSYNAIDWYNFDDTLQYYVDYKEEHQWMGKQLEWTPQTFKIPQEASNIQFRWELNHVSQTGIGGIFIDNFHLYDLEYPIGTFEVLQNSANIPGDQEHWGTEDGQLSFWIPEENEAELKIQSYWKDSAYTPDLNQKIYPQMWTLKSTANNDPYQFGITILDSLLTVAKVVGNGQEKGNIYDYDYFIYHDIDERINPELEDNALEEGWSLQPLSKSHLLPYDKGYIAVLSEEKKGEIWLMDNRIWGKQHPNDQVLDWTIYRDGKNGVKIKWTINPEWMQDLSSLQILGEQPHGGYEIIHQDNLSIHYNEYLDYPHIIEGKSNYKLRINKKTFDTITTEMKTIYWDHDLFYWQLFPNPNKTDPLNIFYSIFDLAPINIQFINSSGQLIHQVELILEEASGHLKMNISHLPAGQYFIKISQGSKIESVPYLKL